MIDRNREYLIETVTLLGPLRNDVDYWGSSARQSPGLAGWRAQ